MYVAAPIIRTEVLFHITEKSREVLKFDTTAAKIKVQWSHFNRLKMPLASRVFFVSANV